MRMDVGCSEGVEKLKGDKQGIIEVVADFKRRIFKEA